MLIVLDSTVLIDYLRGRAAVERVNRLWAVGDVPATTAINVEEIVRGLRTDETSAVDALLEGLWILSITEQDARLAGRWRREFAAQGVTLTQSDCLIAASASGADATLATGNPKDFPMPDLRLDHWPIGK